MSKSTKKVLITLSAMVNVEYTEVVEVPMDFDAHDMGCLAAQRRTEVDFDQYKIDASSTEGHMCSASRISEHESYGPATLSVEKGENEQYVCIERDASPTRMLAH